MRYFILFSVLSFAVLTASGQIRISKVFSDSVSIRGLSVVDDNVAWIGASKGTVALTTDGGLNWRKLEVPGHASSDFRSVYAFSSQKAVIANAGSPANILLTTDGGKNWSVVYSNSHPDAFIDGVDFWNDNEGIMYGDPIAGKMVLLRTVDGGKTWELFSDKSRPALAQGEASFAASGTGIRCVGDKQLYIVSGGVKSRLYCSPDKGETWSVYEPPIVQGSQGTGIFSLTILPKGRLVIVGGDFEKPGLAQNHVFYSDNNGKTWMTPETATGGYRECVELAGERLFAAGPSGVDVSEDFGKSWRKFSDQGFHVVRTARKGKRIIFAGGKGAVGLID